VFSVNPTFNHKAVKFETYSVYERQALEEINQKLPPDSTFCLHGLRKGLEELFADKLYFCQI